MRSATGNTLSSPRSGLPSYNAIDHGTTVRPSSTSLLCIDSEDRYNDYVAAVNAPTSPYDFKINKDNTLMNGFFTRLGVSEVVFPWTIPNINVKTQTISYSYTVGLGPRFFANLTLTPGFYTPAQLATAITASLSTILGLGFTMTYGSASHEPRFQYSVTAGNTVAFYPLTGGSFPYPPQSKQLFNLLGFNQVNEVPAVSGVSDYTLCQAIRYVDIVSPQLTYNQPLKDTMTQTTARDTLCRIYLNSAPGATSTVPADNAAFCPPGCAPTVIYREYANPKQIAWIPNQGVPGYLTFQVYDDAGDLLTNSVIPGYDENYTSDWSMTVLVSEC
jgi:hypothetical protein